MPDGFVFSAAGRGVLSGAERSAAVQALGSMPLAVAGVAVAVLGWPAFSRPCPAAPRPAAAAVHSARSTRSLRANPTAYNARRVPAGLRAPCRFAINMLQKRRPHAPVAELFAGLFAWP